ncbi:MAG: ParB-like nuclease domain-containing protein [Anaerolineae bacterium]|nr:ParB-like nuclease domain-containing protein [Anaerolineae bacterium]
MNTSPLMPAQFDAEASGVTAFNPAAPGLFERARFWAECYGWLGRLFRRSRRLRPLSATGVVFRNIEPVSAQVSIRLIRGSINHVSDYDCDFYPLSDDLETRWVRIASIMLQGNVTLPPVELIRFEGIYYVVDGHHRISVSRMLRRTDVDALVRSV